MNAPWLGVRGLGLDSCLPYGKTKPKHSLPYSEQELLLVIVSHHCIATDDDHSHERALPTVPIKSNQHGRGYGYGH